jgi:hypothetical protein
VAIHRQAFTGTMPVAFVSLWLCEALKARPIPAQGNALGMTWRKLSALKGRTIPHWRCDMARPYRAHGYCAFPRALPWAGIGRAFGALVRRAQFSMKGESSQRCPPNDRATIVAWPSRPCASAGGAPSFPLTADGTLVKPVAIADKTKTPEWKRMLSNAQADAKAKRGTLHRDGASLLKALK